MKLVILTLVVFLSTALSVSAQLKDYEIKTLRKQINISDKDIVRPNKNAGLSAAKPLKIFLAIKRAGSVAKYFEKWIKDWNEQEGDRYGKLERVTDISNADVVLTQFVTETIKNVGETSLGIGNIPPPGQLKSKVRVKSNTDYNKPLKLPVYSYLLKREDIFWTIIYGDVETSLPDEQLSVSPDLRLWQAFKEELKSR
ncbi:MAG: hypothetical protein M3Q78_13045 [Acidobacteriota bacterium]|nr:hypothetical protein [Acidobacteriota bacterium]